MDRVTSSIDKDLKALYKLLAVKRGVSLSEVIRYGLESYMELEGMGELEDCYRVVLPTKPLLKPREVKEDGRPFTKPMCGEGDDEKATAHPCDTGRSRGVIKRGWQSRR